MGRRAKTFTSAERCIDRQKKQQERRKTQRCGLYLYLQCIHPTYACFLMSMFYSGKAMLSLQRHTAYRKHHGRQGSSPIHLPAALITEALQELPEGTYLFRQALGDTEALDETGLDIWDDGPPYTTGPPSDSTCEVEHTQRLIEVMHGRCMRMLRNNPGGDEGTWQERVKEIVEEWQIGDTFMLSYHDGHRELLMAKLWKQWLARTVYYYVQKLKHHK